MEEKYWFVLRSSVFIWKKQSLCYFYDSESFAAKLFLLDNPDIELWIDKLMDIDNLYSVLVSQTELDKENVQTFIHTLVSLGMGCLVNCREVERKPIQFPPILNLQSDVERLKRESVSASQTLCENILLNLHAMQIDLPASENVPFIEALCTLFESLKKVFISEISFTGYQIASNQYAMFWQRMRGTPGVKKFELEVSYVSEDIVQGLAALELPEMQVKLLIKPGFTQEHFEYVRKQLSFASLSYEFQVFEEADCDRIDELVSTLDMDTVRFKPCLNGRNLDFFKKYVYIGEQEILNTHQTKQNIFAHQALNSNDFGKLRITQDGKVYANIHHPPLGTITDDIRWLVYKEMDEGTSWRRIRDKKPCRDCVYQWLCPSLSDYELEIGQPNLCFKNEG